MMNLWKTYRELPREILSVIIAEFFIQWVNASMMYLLPVYMAQLGLTNQEVAWQIVLRFMGVFLLAVPIGKIIHQHSGKAFFYASSLLVPLTGLGVVLSAASHEWLMTKILLFAWGGAFTFMQIPVIPYLMHHTPEKLKTHAISLSYSTWSWGAIFSGIAVYSFHRIHPDYFNEKNLLIGICLSGLAGFLILLFYPPSGIKKYSGNSSPRYRLSSHSARKVAEALFPTLIIAIGAGFTIPFISLFFYRVHHLQATDFSLFSFLAALLVAIGSMQVPYIKHKMGYKKAVPFTQSLAVFFLIVLACTEFLPAGPLSLFLALTAFIFRQPLMNMAGPMTTEIVMEYVGEKNQSFASALTSAIWSGSWVISGLLATWFFQLQYSFFHVFILTAILYIFGIALYYRLILRYEKKITVRH